MEEHVRAAYRGLEYLSQHEEGRAVVPVLGDAAGAYVGSLAQRQVQRDVEQVGGLPHKVVDVDTQRSLLENILRDANKLLEKHGHPRAFPERGNQVFDFAHTYVMDVFDRRTV